MLMYEAPTSSSENGRRKQTLYSMPIDFASYLLSTSPPAFELHYCQRETVNGFPYRDSSKFQQENDQEGLALKQAKLSNLELKDYVSSTTNLSDYVSSTTDLSEYVSSTTAFEDLDEDDLSSLFEAVEVRESQSERELDKINTEQCSTGTYENSSDITVGLDDQYVATVRARKRVSFADEKGKSLYCVKVFHEASDTPPSINTNVLSQITENANASITNVPPFTLDFEQPGTNYIAFREKLEQSCVSLEYVFLKDYNVVGTVKVKNISFDKTVFVRYTVDGWNSYSDKPAVFQPGITNVFDSFQFEFSVPSSHDVTKNIEFCICYMANFQEFWDNNNSTNYRLCPTDWKNTDTGDFCFYDAQNFEDRWAEFSVWHHANARIPYY